MLVSVEGRAIGSGGTVLFRHRERIAFPYIISCRCPGEIIAVELLRDGKKTSAQLPLTWPEPLVPMHPPQPPGYLIFGGLVFVRLSEPYLRSEYGEAFEERAPVCLVEPWLRNVRNFLNEEVVVLSCVFASSLTAGLTHFMNRRLLRCDGQLVRNLAHLAELVDTGTAPAILFEFDDNDLIALPRQAALDITAEVLRANLVPAARCLPTGDGTAQ